MKRTTALGLATLVSLVALGSAAGPASATTLPAPPSIKVMPLGDSITAGVGGSTGAGYRLPLWSTTTTQARYTIDYVGSGSFGAVADPDNEGHSGSMVDEIRSGIDGWVSAANPDVVLLHLGINDLDRGADKEHAADRLSALVDRILADKPGVTVLVQGLIPTTGDLQGPARDFNSKVRALEPGKQAAGQKFRFVEPPALTATEMNDRLHPNDQGYARMSQAFSSALNRAFDDGWIGGKRVLRAGTEAGGGGRARWADFDGDGKADYITIADNGAVSVKLNRGGDGHGGWQNIGQVATGTTSDRARVRFADFDGDGKADYLAIADNGAVTVYLNRGGDGHGGWTLLGQVATGTTSHAEQVRFADFDGDGKADYLTIADSGAVNVYLNRGGDTRGGWTNLGQVATGVTTDRSRLRWADLDGDGKADYTVINSNGSITAYLNRGGDSHGGWNNPGLFAGGSTLDQDQVAFADITGEGRADYLLTEASDGSVNAWTNNGGDTGGGWARYGQIVAGT
ncbi:FG-GAP-like repeat-containing protein [Streptomyces sp. NPDC091204]|uniref:FG-GAP-like repeat-containing protein n=1 Tax=Streptomyces sp. NPDC091204 TaxID=3155299 RepID=UPI003434768E